MGTIPHRVMRKDVDACIVSWPRHARRAAMQVYRSADLVMWGTLTDRRWTVVVAVALGAPTLWYNALATLVAVVALGRTPVADRRPDDSPPVTLQRRSRHAASVPRAG
jgi:hypothetical protein